MPSWILQTPPSLKITLRATSNNSKLHYSPTSKMQFSIITALLTGATIVAALPADMSPRQSTVCPGTDSTPQCCAVNVLDLADLNCANRKSQPSLITSLLASGLASFARLGLTFLQPRKLQLPLPSSPPCAQTLANKLSAACYPS